MNGKGYSDQENYLKGLLNELTHHVEWPPPEYYLEIGGHRIIPDGWIGDEWVVELEGNKGLKSIRGALVDLAVLPQPRKLLVHLFIPGPNTATTPESIEQHLMGVVGRLNGQGQKWCIIVLSGEEERAQHLARIRERLRPHGLIA